MSATKSKTSYYPLASRLIQLSKQKWAISSPINNSSFLTMKGKKNLGKSINCSLSSKFLQPLLHQLMVSKSELIFRSAWSMFKSNSSQSWLIRKLTILERKPVDFPIKTFWTKSLTGLSFKNNLKRLVKTKKSRSILVLSAIMLRPQLTSESKRKKSVKQVESNMSASYFAG